MKFQNVFCNTRNIFIKDLYRCWNTFPELPYYFCINFKIRFDFCRHNNDPGLVTAAKKFQNVSYNTRNIFIKDFYRRSNTFNGYCIPKKVQLINTLHKSISHEYLLINKTTEPEHQTISVSPWTRPFNSISNRLMHPSPNILNLIP